jgi:hypothetical protein
MYLFCTQVYRHRASDLKRDCGSESRVSGQVASRRRFQSMLPCCPAALRPCGPATRWRRPAWRRERSAGGRCRAPAVRRNPARASMTTEAVDRSERTRCRSPNSRHSDFRSRAGLRATAGVHEPDALALVAEPELAPATVPAVVGVHGDVGCCRSDGEHGPVEVAVAFAAQCETHLDGGRGRERLLDGPSGAERCAPSVDADTRVDDVVRAREGMGGGNTGGGDDHRQGT